MFKGTKVLTYLQNKNEFFSSNIVGNYIIRMTSQIITFSMVVKLNFILIHEIEEHEIKYKVSNYHFQFFIFKLRTFPQVHLEKKHVSTL